VIIEAPADLPATNAMATKAEPASNAEPASRAEVAKAEVAKAEPATKAVPKSADRTPAPRRHTEAWAKLIADPGHAPELLALAAVQTIGPRAKEWADRARRDYPTADEAALARLATKQFTRAGGLGSIVGAVAGAYAPVALISAAAITHSELILHLAAAYGLDPTDPDRAVDLLVLTRVHESRGDAEEALAQARRPHYEDGVTGTVWRLGRMVATQVGGWGVVRLVNRYLPGASLLSAFLTSQAAAQGTAARANAYYADR
jgi:hypothetical protein